MYFYTLSVVLDGLAALQAVKEDFHPIVKVGTHILMIHVHAQLEESVYVGVTQSALKVKGFFVFLQYLLLRQAPMPVQGYYLVCVTFRR